MSISTLDGDYGRLRGTAEEYGSLRGANRTFGRTTGSSYVDCTFERGLKGSSYVDFTFVLGTIDFNFWAGGRAPYVSSLALESGLRGTTGSLTC